jgi:uncharacterized membrane protein YdbT with pleckstrin-like domain
MRCSQCGAETPDSSAFCPKCGAALKQPSAPFAPPAAATATAAVPEKTLWTGRFSARAESLHFILWLVWLGILATLYLTLLAQQTRPVHLFLLGAALLPGLLLLFRTAIEKLSTRYRLTNQRLFRQRGLLSRRLDELELIRVDDVSVTQDFVQRLLNVGTVTLLTTDSTDPKLTIEGIADPLALKELIRTQVRARRSRTTFLETL